METMNTSSRCTAFLVTILATVMFAAGPAAASTPATWEDPEPMSTLEALTLFGGSTLALIVVLTLVGLLTARHNYTPPPPGKEIHKVPSE